MSKLGAMNARIYFRHLAGKDPFVLQVLDDDSIVRDYEDYLAGRGQRVQRYALKLSGGHMVVDFRDVTAITFSQI